MRLTRYWKRMVLLTGLIGLSLVAGHRAAWSHAADAMAAPPGAVVIAPRAEARVGQTEIVTIFSKQILAVFLSRYADDTPITGAKIEASTDLQSAALTETDPGVYSTTELLMTPGRNDISLKFTAGGVTSTTSVALPMPIETPEPVVAHPALLAAATPLTIGGAILVVCAMLSGAFLVGRQRARQPAPVRIRARSPAARVA